VSEFGLSGKYFIIHARRPQSHFHFSCRVPGLAGHLPMPSVDTLSVGLLIVAARRQLLLAKPFATPCSIVMPHLPD
jgi:hypothetical protein